MDCGDHSTNANSHKPIYSQFSTGRCCHWHVRHSVSGNLQSYIYLATYFFFIPSDFRCKYCKCITWSLSHALKLIRWWIWKVKIRKIESINILLLVGVMTILCRKKKYQIYWKHVSAVNMNHKLVSMTIE